MVLWVKVGIMSHYLQWTFFTIKHFGTLLFIFVHFLLNHMSHPSQQIHFSELTPYRIPHFGHVLLSSPESSWEESLSSSLELDDRRIAARTSSIAFSWVQFFLDLVFLPLFTVRLLVFCSPTNSFSSPTVFLHSLSSLFSSLLFFLCSLSILLASFSFSASAFSTSFLSNLPAPCHQ